MALEILGGMLVIFYFFLIIAEIFVLITLYKQARARQAWWVVFTAVFSIIPAILWWFVGRKR